MNDGMITTNPPLLGKKGDLIKCDECGNDTFVPVLKLEKFSKLLVGADRDQINSLQVFACAKCHHVNDYFQPDQND